MTTYPGTLDSFVAKTDGVDDVMANDVNELQAAIVAVETELGTDPAASAADVKTRLAHIMDANGFLEFDSAGALTISGGVVTVTQNYHTIDTESGAASDDLDTINGGSDGFVLYMRLANSAHNVVIKYNTGNLVTPGGNDITLDTTADLAIAIYDSSLSKWIIGRVISSGAIDGSGTAAQIPYFTDTDTLTSNAGLTFSTTAGLVGNDASGTAIDFRWETDSSAKALFIDASADELYIGDPLDGAYALFNVYDGSLFLYASADQVLRLGSGAAGIDYYIMFDGETNDGRLYWMEDEDYFRFNDGVLMQTAEEIFFRDTAISIKSADDGHLDLTADVSFDFNTATDTDLVINLVGTTNSGLLTWMEDEDYLKFSDGILMNTTEEVFFRDTAIYIASLDDGHLDLMADVSIDLNTAADTDLVLNFFGTTNSGVLTWMEDEDYFKFSDGILMLDQEAIYFDSTDTYIAANTDDPEDLVIAADQDILLQADNQVVTDTVIRGATSLYRRYYHTALASTNPGASGATWTAPGANSIGGWQLDAAGEVLYLNTDVHSDWDGATDLHLEVRFEVNVNNTGGLVSDTVDLKAAIYYKGLTETVTKSQTVEVATVVGQSAQYKQFEADFTIDWDYALNVVEVGDTIRVILNLETDTSEVDNIIVNDASFYYSTTHVGIESGDT